MPPGAGSLPADLQTCGMNITPACQKALYQIPNAYIKDSENVLGLYESGDKYSQQDLNSFFAKYAPWVPQNTHPSLDSIDGGEAPVAPSSEDNTGESDIDMDISFSLIHVRPSRFLAERKLELIQHSLKQSHSTKSTMKSKPRPTVDSTPSSTPSTVPTAPTQPTA